MYYRFILVILQLKINLFETLQFNIHPDRDLSITDIFSKHGYPVELHELVTDDGYILTLHRIPRGKDYNKSNNEHPVLMVHGTCGGAENFIIAGPGKAISYYMADRGFDVWLLNTRGSRHSRKHTTLNPDTDKKYWDFGWHEVAVSDTPSAIDYILKVTNKTKLFYFGHSQGSTSYFAFASERPEYNSKINIAVNSAPSCLLGDVQNLVRLMGKHSSLIQELGNILNLHEIFPRGYTELLNLVLKTLCSEMTFFVDLCYAILYFGNVYGDMEPTTPQFVFSKAPGHCSLKQLLHYFQIVYSGKQYDYGVEGNLRMYGTKSPPLYSFSNMTAPIALFYASEDNICPSKGVERLAKLLPNLAMRYKVPSNTFGHVDFIFGKRVGRLVNEPVYQLFKKYL
ncbi:hypothetical protein NQ315_004100 [Exocentrus adspersus]|uniref:Lipase n=1 Tax=Exocentrus adspersus TaxID=1586481 RepID=A0AAV8W6A5_9CUCU|nr:hypothetical protein NQ315_004100 [Exocentrus adspersus]